MTHDRLEQHRGDDAWLRTQLPDARAIVLTDDGVGEVIGFDHAEELDGPALIGRDRAERVVIAVDATRGRNPGVASRLPDVMHERVVLTDHPEPSLILHALGLARWHSRTRHCPRCGTRLDTQPGGYVLQCPNDGSLHFPRLEPAIIVAVVDDDDRLLLGRQEVWPEGRFSTLAGFVEPGETIEDTCRREVAEESGVQVGEVHYVASQPWPFPASLMLGLYAFAETTEIVLEDEIVEAHWFTREGLAQARADGEIKLPPPVSIAHRLITGWIHGTLEPRISFRQS